ncbi:unnamed protein product [Periconia digitata]|uniref:Beta-lactamase-related domain-containing protein n=1 Tax=Periconia digitata TaxID=1303443 RepID=A0A9W4U438_9PLEO|nr:unnamed protein product [Periconia digitata]
MASINLSTSNEETVKTDFDVLLSEYTQKETPKVHGVIAKCVDKNGKEVYNKIAGYDSVLPDASPLREDAVMKIASATKLITAIALLQCVEEGLLELDEPLTKILPEFDGIEILKGVNGSDLTLEKSNVPVTARHLLSHTSGLGYQVLHPLLALQAEMQKDTKRSGHVTEKYKMPLVFEPGTGWLYGCSFDWAGLVVSRLHNDIALGDYFTEHIWKRVGLSAPFPRFNIAVHPDYKARMMQSSVIQDNGTLEHLDNWPIIDDDEAHNGGEGLSCTANDYLAVLADLISDAPKLLKPETIFRMWEPQLLPGSPGSGMLLSLRPLWETITGPIVDHGINHGLGGVLCLEPVPESKQPANMLAWGGATNVVWWMNKASGVAGFFATQQAPTANPNVTKLVEAWKKDFWTQYGVNR